MSSHRLLADAKTAMDRNDFSAAAAVLTRAAALEPNDAQAWFLLGVCLDADGKLEQALDAFGKAAALQPGDPQAANAQAVMLSLLERWQEALAAFGRVLAIRPGDPHILANLGMVHEKLGRDDEALRCYDAALKSDPRHPGALNNSGILLLKLGEKQAALDAHLRFVAAAPDSPIGHYNCAETYAALLQDDKALAACDAALRLAPHHVKAHVVRGLMLAGMGRFDEAGTALATAKKIDPAVVAATLKSAGLDIAGSAATDPRYLYCVRGKERLECCDWTGYAEFVATFAELVAAQSGAPARVPDYSALAHFALALPLPPEAQLTLARNAAAAAQTRCGTVSPRPHAAGSRIRIGFVSPNFRSHPNAHLTCGLYSLFDRSRFEVYAYSLQPDDGSAVRRRIAAGCDVFRECVDWSTQRIIESIRDDGIDILVDLAGYTDHARPEIFASRPAPISVGYLGFPGSTGAAYIDYRITDRVASPAGQERYFTEKLVYLPGSCMPYNDSLLIEPPGARKDHGLPGEAFVFCCFNNAYKIQPEIFAVWMKLLQTVPQGVLWIYAPTAAVEKNLQREAAGHGIDPQRLIFAPPQPHAPHIGRYQLADLFLDTLYCGSHTTSLDALWAGLPVLTCAGSTFAARLCASHLSQLGLPDLITESVEGYAERARELALDGPRLAAIRATVSAARSSAALFRTETSVRDLERAWIEMWRRHQAGQAPASFALA
jgi:protein O-GlcNAc transferase